GPPSPLALASSLCFNLDTDQPTIFRVDSAGFGHSVVQYANWLVVGAPQEVRAANQTGGLYRCDYSTSLCEAIHLQVPPEAVNMSLGLSMAATTKPFQLLVSCPGSREHPERGDGDLEALGQEVGKRDTLTKGNKKRGTQKKRKADRMDWKGHRQLLHLLHHCPGAGPFPWPFLR
uniref:Integrin alpha-2 domain-containing protein n=1 Tax=Sus scrofa TaxID=9823 RepID=A0A8D1UDL7_PIG